jgi:hypothetical protein
MIDSRRNAQREQLPLQRYDKFGGEVPANAATLMPRECDHRYIKQINICSILGKVKVKNDAVS